MVRPGRERLRGAVEVDEAYWGAPEEGAVGRLTEDKALIAVAVEEDRDGIGRIRLHRIPNVTRATLQAPRPPAAAGVLWPLSVIRHPVSKQFTDYTSPAK